MFSAAQLVEIAKTRYGVSILRNRVVPGGTVDTKDAQLLVIAEGVIGAVQAAAQSNVGWPLPGAWPTAFVSPIDASAQLAGVAYEDIWPYDLLQKALELFDWRTQSVLEVVSAEKVKIGQAAEAWLRAVARGDQGLALGVETDTSPPDPIAARDRSGRNLLGDGGVNSDRLVDQFVGAGWDWVQ